MTLEERIILFSRHPWVRKISTWATGISLYYWLTWLYDYLVISYLLWEFGNIIGGIIVLLTSMAIDLGTFLFYDWFKKDWLAIESLKELEDKQGRFPALLRWLKNQGALMTILVLSIYGNPFLITMYMRKGSHQYNGMNRRDWVIFVSSSIITNVYWIFIVGSGISIIEYVVKLFS